MPNHKIVGCDLVTIDPFTHLLVHSDILGLLKRSLWFAGGLFMLIIYVRAGMRDKIVCCGCVRIQTQERLGDQHRNE